MTFLMMFSETGSGPQRWCSHGGGVGRNGSMSARRSSSSLFSFFLCILFLLVLSLEVPTVVSAEQDIKHSCGRIRRCSECVYDPTDGLMPPDLDCGWCQTTRTCLEINSTILAYYNPAISGGEGGEAALITEEERQAMIESFCKDLRARELNSTCPDMQCSAAHTTNNVYFCRGYTIFALVVAILLLIATAAMYVWSRAVRQLPWKYEPALSTLIAEKEVADNLPWRRQAHTVTRIATMTTRTTAPGADGDDGRSRQHTGGGITTEVTILDASQCNSNNKNNNNNIGRDDNGESEGDDIRHGAESRTSQATRPYCASPMTSPLVASAATSLARPSSTLALPPPMTSQQQQHHSTRAPHGCCPICKCAQPALLGPGEVCFWCGVARYAFVPIGMSLSSALMTIFLIFLLSLKPWFSDYFYTETLLVALVIDALAVVYVVLKREKRIPLFPEEEEEEEAAATATATAMVDATHGRESPNARRMCMRTTTYIRLALLLRGRSLSTVFPGLIPPKEIPAAAGGGSGAALASASGQPQQQHTTLNTNAPPPRTLLSTATTTSEEWCPSTRRGEEQLQQQQEAQSSDHTPLHATLASSDRRPASNTSISNLAVPAQAAAQRYSRQQQQQLGDDRGVSCTSYHTSRFPGHNELMQTHIVSTEAVSPVLGSGGDAESAEFSVETSYPSLRLARHDPNASTRKRPLNYSSECGRSSSAIAAPSEKESRKGKRKKSKRQKNEGVVMNVGMGVAPTNVPPTLHLTEHSPLSNENSRMDIYRSIPLASPSPEHSGDQQQQHGMSVGAAAAAERIVSQGGGTPLPPSLTDDSWQRSMGDTNAVEPFGSQPLLLSANDSANLFDPSSAQTRLGNSHINRNANEKATETEGGSGSPFVNKDDTRFIAGRGEKKRHEESSMDGEADHGSYVTGDDDNDGAESTSSAYAGRFTMLPMHHRRIPHDLYLRKRAETARLLAANFPDPNLLNFRGGSSDSVGAAAAAAAAIRIQLKSQMRETLKQALVRDEVVLWCGKPTTRAVWAENDWLITDLAVGFFFGIWMIILASVRDTSYTMVRLTSSTACGVMGTFLAIAFFLLLTLTVRGCDRVYVLTDERLLTLYNGLFTPVVTSTELSSVRFAAMYGYKSLSRHSVLTFSWEVPATERKLPPIKSHTFAGIVDTHNFLHYFRLVAPRALTGSVEETTAAALMASPSASPSGTSGDVSAPPGVSVSLSVEAPSDANNGHRNIHNNNIGTVIAAASLQATVGTTSTPAKAMPASMAANPTASAAAAAAAAAAAVVATRGANSSASSMKHDRQEWRLHFFINSGVFLSLPLITVYPSAFPISLALWLLLMLWTMTIATISRALRAQQITYAPLNLAEAWSSTDGTSSPLTRAHGTHTVAHSVPR